MNPSRRAALRTTGLALSSAVWPTADAQDVYVRHGRLLFGFAPGAIGSTLGKEFTQLLASRHNPLFRLENITAAGSMRSIEMTKRAPVDGRTLVQVQSSQVALLPLVQREVPYDPLVDLVPVAMLSSYTWAFTVGPAVPADIRSMADYLRWVAQNPEWRQFGATLFGSQGHLAGLMTARQQGVALRPQTYAGTGPMVKDLLAQSLAAGYVIVGNAPESFANGSLRALAVLGDQRWPSLPEVPTFKELGLHSIERPGWYAWYAPAGTPAEVLDPIRAAVQVTLDSPECQSLLKRLQQQPADTRGAALVERLRGEQRYFGAIARDLHIGALLG